MTNENHEIKEQFGIKTARQAKETCYLFLRLFKSSHS